MRDENLSTPWVAGSNPAGIAPATSEKSPINKGFSHIRELPAYSRLLERKGINRDKNGPSGSKIPGKSPGLVSLCGIKTALACQIRPIRGAALAAVWLAIATVAAGCSQPAPAGLSRGDAIVRAAAASNNFVLVAGDSIVERATLPASVCGLPIVNGGISGARASTLLPLLEDLATSARPRLIILAVGVNNTAIAYRDARAFAAVYDELARKAAAMSPLLLATVTPIDTSQEVGKTLDSAARDDVNRTILAAAEKFASPPIRLDQLATPAPMTRDGVHLDAAAATAWSAAILAAASAALGC